MGMQCVISGFHLNDDVDGKYTGFIKSALEDVQEQYIIAAKLNSGKLQHWAVKNKDRYEGIKTENDVLKLNGNTFKKLVVDYMNVIRPSVVRNTVKKQNDNIGNFTSKRAKVDAQLYTANRVLIEYYKSLSANSEMKYKDKVALFTTVRSQILEQFAKRFDKFLAETKANGATINIVIQDENGKNKKVTLETEIARLKEEATKVLADKTLSKKDKKNKVWSLQQQSINLKIDAMIKANSGDIRYINFAELARNIFTVNGFNRWYNDVLNNYSCMFEIKRNLDNLKFKRNDLLDGNEIEEEYEGEEGNEDDMERDAQTAFWDDARLKDFSKFFNSRLNLYLNTIPKRSASIVGIADETMNLEENDNLGTPEFMDASYIKNQIIQMGPFYSLQDFVNKLEQKATTISSLYGLGQIVNDMKKDMKFANFVFAQFNKPIIRALQVRLGENTSNIIVGNSDSFADNIAYYSLYGDSSMVGREEYDRNDVDKLNDITIRQETLLNKEDKTRNAIKNKVVDYINRHFPSINTEKFVDYFFDNPNTATVKQLNELLGLLREYNSALETHLKNEHAYNRAYYKAKKEYNQKVQEYNEISGQGLNIKKPEPPEYDASKINSNAKSQALMKLANFILPIVDSNVRFNTPNAKGTMSSSMIKNNYLMNFLKQLKMDIDSGGTGQKLIKDFFSKRAYDVCDVETNIFLFGLYSRERNQDGSRKVLRPGLFKRLPNGEYVIDVTSKVAKTFGINLLDGVKKEDKNDGIVYTGMSREDYLLTAMKLSDKGIRTEETTQDEVSGCGNIIMRIPSDASNTYTVQMEKYDTGTIFEGEKTKEEEEKSNVEEILSEEELMLLKDMPEMNEMGIMGMSEEEIRMLGTESETEIKNDEREDLKPRTGKINRNTVVFAAYRNELWGELQNFATQLNSVFEQDKNGNWISKTDTKNLFEVLHYNGSIVENGRLTGREFEFAKLFKIDNNESVNDALYRLLGIYDSKDSVFGKALFTQLSDGRLQFNIRENDVFRVVNQNGRQFITVGEDFDLHMNQEVSEGIDNIVDNWMQQLVAFSYEQQSRFTNILGSPYNTSDFLDWMINTSLAYMTFDGIFEGSSKFYKDAKTFLKRAKETQMGGSSYAAFDFQDDIGNEIRNTKDLNGNDNIIEVLDDNGKNLVDSIPTWTGNGISQKPLFLRTGFRAITIKNSKTKYKYAQNIYNLVHDNILRETGSEQSARSVGLQVAGAWGDVEIDGVVYKGKSTKSNDAQSYITVEEFIRRKYADGTLEEYLPLLKQLIDPTIPVEEINMEQVTKLIQPQKNVYYDLQYDSFTGKHYPRQIKNAEFVLIPKLLPQDSSLLELYNFMRENDLGQVNTAETSKAANKNVLEYWDDEGNANLQGLQSSFTGDVIEEYYYKNLYKQQDVVNHIGDTVNKAGIQFFKKLMDNQYSYSQNVQDSCNIIQKTIAQNIRESFDNLCNELGWRKNENGDIVNKDGSQILKFDKFYKKCLDEFQRTGIDDNIKDYLTPDLTGVPIMPESLSVVSTKLENIAQAVFNSTITRQTLPGYHGTQVTNIGYGEDLKYHPPGENGNVNAVVEIRISDYHPAIKELINKYGKEEALRRFNEAGLNNHIGYRIPTEGKQSMAVFKIVEFLDESYGSTIIVSNEWVTQTGSDFDIDSIYSLVYELEFDGENIRKIEYNDSNTHEGVMSRYIQNVKDRIKRSGNAVPVGKQTEKFWLNLGEVVHLNFNEFKNRTIEQQLTRSQRNNRIVDNAIKILSDESVREEIYGRSNFDDIIVAKNELEELSGLGFNEASVYNPISQLQFMQNAIDGRKLKAFSVNRDTFCSICNKVRPVTPKFNGIQVIYDETYDANIIKAGYEDYIENNDEINGTIVTHRQFGWSKNNRNVVGRLITSYSSETTAHILDAIKEGSLFNETDFTFGTFKTLIDLGIDYKTAISWLMQPGITMLNQANNNKNSIYLNDNSDPILTTIKNLAVQIGIAKNQYTSMRDICENLLKNQEYLNVLDKNFGGHDKYYPNALDTKALRERLKRQKEYNELGISPVKGDLMFDLAVVFQFRSFKRLTNSIEDLSKVLRPDAFGAKQIIRSTREVVENVEKYRNPKSKKGHILVDEKGIGIVESVYGENSSYEYMKAYYENATKASVDINSQLFFTEHGKFLELTRNIEQRIGKRLTDKEYQDAKKYLVHRLYDEIPLLNQQVSIDDHGFVIVDKPAIEKQAQYDYWNNERGRIYGFVETEINDIDIDINNPTPEQLERYKKLTPAQKILFIKRHFSDIGYFDKLTVTKSFKNELTTKKYSYNRIFVDDTTFSIDIIRQEFLDAFLNKNKLVKLAAIDLVKYSFLVEGFDFKRRSISKTIPNVILYTDVLAGGLGIVSEYKKAMNQIDMPNYLHQYITDNFVRSHPDIIKSTKVNRGSKNHPNPVHQKLLKLYDRKNGLLVVPKVDAFNDVIKTLNLNNKGEGNYIRVEGWFTGKHRTTLYKVIDNIYSDNIYLIPINYLEAFENSEYSVNNANNEWNDYAYYANIVTADMRYSKAIYELQEEKSVDDFLDLGELEITKSQEEIDEELLAEEKGKELDLLRQIQREIPKYKFESSYDERKFMNQLELGTEAQKRQIKKFFDDIEDAILNGNSEIDRTLIRNASEVVKKGLAFTDKEKSRIIEIPFFDSTARVEITRYDIGELRKYQGSKREYNGNTYSRKTSKEVKYYSDKFGKLEEWDIVYSVRLISSPELKESMNDEDIRNSKYASYNSGYSNSSFTGGELNALAPLIAKDLRDNARRGDEEAIKALGKFNLLGINSSSTVGLVSRQTSVYAIAEKYYKKTYDALMAEMNAFTREDGRTFKISDKELYKGLTQEDAEKLISLVLKANNFGYSLREFTDFEVVGEDEETNKAVQSLRSYVNNIKSSPLLKSAFDNIYNIYMAEAYAQNPAVKIGLIDVTTLFGDTSKFTAEISDIGHLPHKQIQLVVKSIAGMLSAAEYDGRQKVQDFDKWISENLTGKFNDVANKIIDENGRFIMPYSDKFIEDRDKFREELKSTQDLYGRDSIQYFDKKLAYDKWLHQNTEQGIVPEYYKDKIDAQETVRRLGGATFEKYYKLTTQLNTLYSDNYNLTPDQKREKQILIDAINELLTDEYDDGSLKPSNERKEIMFVQNYRGVIIDLNKKYFEYSETKQFRENLEHNLEIIKNYDAKHNSETLAQKLRNLEYKIAYEWIASNSRYKLNEEAQKALNEAHKALNIGPVQRSLTGGIRQIFAKHRQDGDLYDAFGRVIGTNFTTDEIQKIHDIEQKKYSPVEGDMHEFSSDGTLIKNVPETPMLTQAFWINNYLADNEKSPEVVAMKRELFTKINAIISKGIDKDQFSQNRGKISARRLFDSCTQEELDNLAEYYYQLKMITSGRKEKHKKSLFKFKYNEAEFAKQFAEYKTMNPVEKRTFEAIFCECDETGGVLIDDDGKFTPNGFIYGYVELKENVAKVHPEFFDTKREEARKLLDENVYYEPTEYYYNSQNQNVREAQQIYDDAIANGKTEKEARELQNKHIDDWFNVNHVWNQRENKWQPIQIWTVRRIKENGTLPGNYEYVAVGDNVERDVKEEYINPNYNQFGSNYKSSTGRYNNGKYTQILANKESDEYKLWNKLVNGVMREAEINMTNRRFIEQGFAPRKYKAIENTEWYLRQGLSMIGLNFRNYNNNSWTENFDYAHDHDIRNPMLDVLKAKGYEGMEKIPQQEEGQSDEDYKKVVNEITKRNKERQKHNLELEAAVRDRDWNAVFKNFIYNTTIYNAKERAKNSGYLLLEDLRQREAYRVNNFGRISKTNRSTESIPDYNMSEQRNTFDIAQNWLRRVIFGEYKRLHPLVPIADTLQNMASAKYMMYNLYAGINNVTVGGVNVLGEVFAKEYFDKSDFFEASKIYDASIVHYLKDMFSETSNDKTCAILKLFDAVEIDKMLEFADSDFSATKVAEFINTMNFSMQSGGEHMMQNKALIAMLVSQRIWKDEKGRTTFGSFQEYTQMIEDAALRRVISGNEYLSAKYQAIINKTKSDKQLQYEFDKLKRNPINDFFNTLSNEEKRKYGDKYIELRKEMLKNDREEFEQLPTIWSQLELKDGVAKFTEESGIDANLFGLMKNRAVYINKRIHGVYDKNGAAMMERAWYGSLIMQFKKHVYPGIMKRWRTAGYYNEIRGTYEKGSYISVADFLATEFKGIKEKVRERGENGESSALSAIQETFKACYNTLIDFKFNYDMLPEFERANIRRAMADLCGIMASLLTIFAVYALADDDDLEDNTFLNSTLYLADRLYGESRMFTPFGAVPEIKTQWNQPVAGKGVAEDLYDAMSYITQWLFDPDFEPVYKAGPYKGRNKVEVKVLKNIPAVRTINRIQTINKSNKYYRIGDNQTAQKLAKNLAFTITGRND